MSIIERYSWAVLQILVKVHEIMSSITRHAWPVVHEIVSNSVLVRYLCTCYQIFMRVHEILWFFNEVLIKYSSKLTEYYQMP